MKDVLDSIKRFFKNKNTVTILGVVIILILLYVGYSVQIKRHIEPISVPVAVETIQPRTLITKDMITYVEVPRVSVSENVLTSNIVGNYSNVNSVIPAGSMFYQETVIKKEELPDYSFTKVKKGQVAYRFSVDMETTYGNSIFPGNKIDMYMKIGDGNEEKIMIGKLLKNIEVLAVKDSAGRAVFENTSEYRTPSMLIFGLSEDLYLLLRKASYMSSLGVELYPVPQGTALKVKNSTEVSTQQLVEYINAHAVDIPVQEEEEVVDELEPVISSNSTSFPTNVTIEYPKGCGSAYTCTYQKDTLKAVTVKKSTATVNFSSSGSLTATVTEKDGTIHKKTVNIPLVTNSSTTTDANASNSTEDANS